MMSLKDKVTLITGASSGIGAATAIVFAKLGARLALNGRDVENLKKVAEQCIDCGADQVCLVEFLQSVFGVSKNHVEMMYSIMKRPVLKVMCLPLITKGRIS